MHASLVMTIIGPDRTGLVETLANRVAEHGGNWLESRMSHLGGQFAGLLRIEIPTEGQEELLRALKELEKQGLKVVAQTAQKISTPTQPTATLEIVGHDRPGIVRQISRALAMHGVNVEELDTECVSAPMSGETLFKAHVRLQIPPSCNVAALREDLEKIAGELMADVTFAT